MHFSFFFFNDTATTEIYTLSLHDALPIYRCGGLAHSRPDFQNQGRNAAKDFSCIDGFRLKRQTILWKELFKRPLLCGRGPALAQDVASDRSVQAALGCEDGIVPSTGELGAAL